MTTTGADSAVVDHEAEAVSRSHTPAWWEFAFVCTAMFLSGSALLPLLSGGDPAGSTAGAPDDRLSRYAWLVLLVLRSWRPHGAPAASSPRWPATQPSR